MSFILLGILNAQAAGAGAAGAYDLLETQILTSSATSVEFTGLGDYSDYKHLQLRMTARSTLADVGGVTMQIRLNSDSGNNYARHRLQGDGSSVSSGAEASRNSMELGVYTFNNEATGIFGASVIDILDFSNSSKNSTLRSLDGWTASGTNRIALRSGLWNNTAAVTSVLVIPGFDRSFLTGSRFSLYGIKGE
jgi:hypothetical protein